jgi:hypothetical protein
MKTTSPLLVFFTGIITALFFYQFFGNSLLYLDANSETNNKETKLISPISSIAPNDKLLETVRLDISTLKDDIEALQTKLETLPMTTNSQSNYTGDLATLKKEIITFQKMMNDEMKTYNKKQKALLNALAFQKNQEDATDNTNNTSPTTEADMMIVMQQSENKLQQEVETIHQNFQTEPLNEQWTSEVKQNITHYFDHSQKQSENEGQNENEIIAQSTLSSIDCRSTMCQMDVQHENEEAREKFDLEFPESLGDSFPSIQYGEQITHSDGSSSAVLFLERNVETSQGNPDSLPNG